MNQIDNPKIQETFICSKQLVIQDDDQKHYKNLVFIEFLEFISRIGQLAYKSNYVRQYGLDRVEVRISKAEPTLQFVEVIID